jgi:hypothetical protein
MLIVADTHVQAVLHQRTPQLADDVGEVDVFPPLTSRRDHVLTGLSRVVPSNLQAKQLAKSHLGHVSDRAQPTPLFGQVPLQRVPHGGVEGSLVRDGSCSRVVVDLSLHFSKKNYNLWLLITL